MKDIEIEERKWVKINMQKKGEKKLGRRGIYGRMGGERREEKKEMEMMWVINIEDGGYQIIEMEERQKMKLEMIEDEEERIRDEGLIKEKERKDIFEK